MPYSSQDLHLPQQPLPVLVIFDSVFVYATDTANAKYSVNFSLVGQGKGNYVPASSNANGRVYEWVGPFVDTLGVDYPQGS